MDSVYSWEQEHPEEYSRFSLDMMKVERNNFSSLERIFKMAAGFVLTSVLVECSKFLHQILKECSLLLKVLPPPAESLTS